jgi:hypothetical protein
LRYQSQLHRTFDRAFASLRALQQSRKAAVQSEPLPEAPAATENESIAKGTQDPINPPESNTMPPSPLAVLPAAQVQPDPSGRLPDGHARNIEARPGDDATNMQKWA